MTALPLIAAAISSIIDFPVKTYDDCIAEGLDPNKTFDIELIHKYSLTVSNDNGEFVQRPIFKQYEENVKKNGYYVENDESVEYDVETDESVEHDVENDEPEHDDENDEPAEHDVENDEPIEHYFENDELAEHDIENDEPVEHFVENDEKIDDKNTIKPSDVYSDEKIENDEKNIQIPMKPIRIFAYYHRNYVLNVTTNDTVLELKKKIRSMLGVDIKKISLSFSTKPLEDNRALESYNIKQDDTILVSRNNDVENDEPVDINNDKNSENDVENPIQIPTKTVRIFAYYHKNYTLNVTTNDTVLGLKKKLRSMLGIDIKKIRLSFSNKPLEDHRTLESYNIKQNDTILVSRRNDAENVETYGHDVGNDEHDFEKIDDKKTIKSADLEKTIQIPTEPIRIFAYYHKNYALNVTTKDTVLGLKKKLRSMLGTDIKKISLSYSSKPLEDHRTLESYNIKQNDTIHVSRKIMGGSFDYLVLKNDDLDPKYDNDFTNQRERDGWTFKRGNEPYKPPYGWNRFAINIKRYGNDIKWIGTDKNSWPVSFHGTNKDAAENIAKDGFDLLKGKRFLYGKGIYSSPDFKEAERYAKRFFHQDCEYKVIIQNRVNPNDLRKANNDLYWITADDKNIRPYGICIKKA
ncbi:38138_t:CDS:1 [Gigaspora margarita]|uniref:38138_t:CDS:1 n=1 Tax=Gigaspora margarita TaxID=4874 RepID=A0ABN7VM62_GIGMA|nr:38138_t:CDS:1 [Gigaspora margarita]